MVCCLPQNTEILESEWIYEKEKLAVKEKKIDL